MNYTNLIISTGLIAIPDTLQTPRNVAVLTNPRQLGEKENGNTDESNCMVINCLHIISSQAVSRVTQTTPRHLPDTFQTPYRDHKYGTYFTNPRQLGDKKPLIQNFPLGVYQLLAHHTPQTVSRVTQTTPRHLSDNFQTTFRHSEAPGREGTS